MTLFIRFLISRQKMLNTISKNKNNNSNFDSARTNKKKTIAPSIKKSGDEVFISRHTHTQTYTKALDLILNSDDLVGTNKLQRFSSAQTFPCAHKHTARRYTLFVVLSFTVNVGLLPVYLAQMMICGRTPGNYSTVEAIVIK